jgi:hypothetical protein
MGARGVEVVRAPRPTLDGDRDLGRSPRPRLCIFGVLVGFEDDWDSTTEQAVFIALTLLGAAVLLSGLFYPRRRGRPGAGLIILGAIVYGFMIWWTIAGALIALAVIVLTIVWARRPLATSP